MNFSTFSENSRGGVLLVFRGSCNVQSGKVDCETLCRQSEVYIFRLKGFGKSRSLAKASYERSLSLVPLQLSESGSVPETEYVYFRLSAQSFTIDYPGKTP